MVIRRCCSCSCLSMSSCISAQPCSPRVLLPAAPKAEPAWAGGLCSLQQLTGWGRPICDAFREQRASDHITTARTPRNLEDLQDHPVQPSPYHRYHPLNHVPKSESFSRQQPLAKHPLHSRKEPRGAPRMQQEMWKATRGTKPPCHLLLFPQTLPRRGLHAAAEGFQPKALPCRNARQPLR